MINTIRQYRQKTRKAFLMANRVEDMVNEIMFLLKDENDELTSLKKQLKKGVKDKPNVLQTEGLKYLKEIEDLRNGKLKSFILADGMKNATKNKK
tara:strand:+ start:679 stop:963 length:285 start_codon:yes stop_codon:yes gene_type:complete